MKNAKFEQRVTDVFFLRKGANLNRDNWKLRVAIPVDFIESEVYDIFATKTL